MSTKIGTLTRALAIDALTHILSRHNHADVAMEKLFVSHPNLRTLDKAFIFEIVMGSLRWLSKMDWIMGHMTDRPFSSLDPRVVNALRVGAYQIYYMDRVPQRAAVSETVEAIKQVGVPNASSFVNAILRRVAKKSDYFPKPDKEKAPLDYYPMQFAHPAWLVARWYKRLPLERFQHLLINNNKPPKHTLRQVQRNPLPPGNEDLPTYLLKTHSLASTWRPLARAFRVESLPRFASCEAFQKGCYFVQEESSQLVASLVKPEPQQTCLDACAAPGGKALFLWDEGLEPQRLTVCDVSAKRLQLLSSNFQRVGLEGATVWCGDVVEKAQGVLFDKILLDAPCSSLGVVRRHPEIKWHRTPQDIARCAQEQARLLAGLATSVAPGGEIIYSVCSFEEEETIQVIDPFLKKHPQFSKVSPLERLHPFYRKYVTKHQELCIYGGNPDDLDGFFAVILTRSA